MYSDVTQRIRDIIDSHFKGNVTAFSNKLGYASSQKVNRLFTKDKRSGEYPVASIDILIDISNKLDISLDYLVKGEDEKKASTSGNAELIQELRERIKDKDELIKVKDVVIEKSDKLINLLEKKQKDLRRSNSDVDTRTV